MLKAKGKVHYDNVFREFKDRFNTPNATWSYLDKYFIRAGKSYFGAFVELEPGLDGLVHISEVANMSTFPERILASKSSKSIS